MATHPAPQRPPPCSSSRPTSVVETPPAMGLTMSHCEAAEKEEAMDTPSPEEEPKEEAEGEQEEEEAETDDTPEVKVETVPHDYRFSGTNQARACYTRYNEYYRCIAQKDEDNSECKFYAKAYRAICPAEWLERWNELRDNGAWPGKY